MNLHAIEQVRHCRRLCQQFFLRHFLDLLQGKRRNHFDRSLFHMMRNPRKGGRTSAVPLKLFTGTKLAYLASLLISTGTVFADTNSTTLNQHERFYANYRAQKARYERAIADLKKVRDREQLIAEKKAEARIEGRTNAIVSAQYLKRINALELEIKRLDVARLEYEKKYPEAAQYAQSPTVKSNLSKLQSGK